MKKPILFSTASAAAAVLLVMACTDQAKAKPNFVTKEAPRPGVVAKIGGQEITEAELIGEEKLDFFELKKREHELRMERLNKLVVDRLIGAEAAKEKLSLDEYINKKIVKGEIKISDKDYNAFVKEKRIPESQLNPQIKERITAYLQTQKRQDLINAQIAKLTKSEPVEVYFSKPRMDVKVEVGEAPVWGKADAPVTIVEFSDFQCPFCSRGAETIDQVKKKYGEKKVKIAFKHFPLPMHKEAGPASEMSMCVKEIGGADKFWKFHDLAFKTQDKLDDASLAGYAKSAGVDQAKAEECYKSGKYKQFVAADMKYGETVGVRSTPTFFINGQIVSGALPIEAFSEIIDEELALAKK